MTIKNPDTTTDQRWGLLGDASADGEFIYAVITTGIYCRPGCPSRRPNPDNVRFFSDHSKAEAAGFRACKRCFPQHLSKESLKVQRVSDLCRFIESSGQEPSLAELAEYSGVSIYHLQRLFKTVTGLTPKAYAKAHRQQYEISRKIPELPEQIAMTIYFAQGKCSLGDILVAQSEKGICAVLMGDEPNYLLDDLKRRFPEATVAADDNVVGKTVKQIIEMVEQPQLTRSLPLDIRGTLFQQRVWQALQQIPIGETRSYSEIATAIGSPNAVRAVASACGANAIAIIVPCHRVVRNDGNLSGYRWGVERKKKLLQKEAEHIKT